MDSKRHDASTTERDCFLQFDADMGSGAGEERVEQPPGVMSILCLVALKRRLWLLPILTSGWLFSSFWISYSIAVSYNHTEANFPYISHTAIEAPERCVFGQMVNIGAVMLGMNVILRYLYIKKFLLCKRAPPHDRWYKINLAGLVLGILSAFGLSMVANFQTEVQRGPHYFGAGLAFGLGTIYCWFQSCLSYRVRYHYSGKRVIVAAQFLNSVIMTSMLLIFGISKAYYKLEYLAGRGTKWDILRGVYLTSTITEWLLALAVLTFTLTYAFDFKHMRLDDPNIYLHYAYEKKHSCSTGFSTSDTNSNIKQLQLHTARTADTHTAHTAAAPHTHDTHVANGQVDTSSGQVDTSSGQVDTSSGQVNTTSGQVNTSSGQVDTSSGQVEKTATEPS